MESDFLNSFGMGSTTGSEPPLSTDGLAGDKAAGAVKSDTGKESANEATKSGVTASGDESAGAAKKSGAVDEEEVEDEDDDEPGVAAAIKAAPVDKQEALEKTRKAAKFESHVKNPSKPAKDIVKYMRSISEARYDDIAREVVKERLADPASFIDNDVDDETFAAIASEVIRRDPAWVIRKITGRADVKLSDIVEGLEARANGAAQTIEMPDFSGAFEEGLKDDYPEVAEYLEAQKLASGDGLPKAFTSKLQAAEAEVTRLKAELDGKGKADARTPKPGEKDEDKGKDKVKAHPDTAKVQRAVEEDLGEYIEKHARDKDGLDLDVTDAEREAAPEVAELKDTFINEWIFGSTSKKVPSFAAGVLEHFKDNEKFKEAAKQVAYFAMRGEKDNAVAEARSKLRRFIDTYRKARVELPSFKRLAGLIAKESKAAGTSPRVETHIPGGGSRTSSPGSAKGQTDDDIVNGWGMS